MHSCTKLGSLRTIRRRLFVNSVLAFNHGVRFRGKSHGKSRSKFGFQAQSRSRRRRRRCGGRWHACRCCRYDNLDDDLVAQMATATSARATIALLALIFLLPASAFHATLPTNRHTSISQRRTLTPLCQEAAPPPAEFDPEKCTFPGCDGKGRAIGGLGAMKYFEWWPIKVRSVCASNAR